MFKDMVGSGGDLAVSGVHSAHDDSAFHPKGYVKIFVDDELVHETSNLVVVGYRESLTNLLLYSGVQTGYLKSFSLGTGGVNAEDPATPIPPVFEDAALKAAVFEKDITEKQLEQTNTLNDTLLCRIQIDRSEANNEPAYALSEAGLMTAGNKLFARVTFPVVYKTSDRKLTFEWRIKFE